MADDEIGSEDVIRYDVLAQEALRGVVRTVLRETVKTGLPGDHHFYISFDTRHPGVRLSTRMREQYPEEMTIVVQHQFWDLKANEHNFEIGLSFNEVPESLLVPYAAIKGFFDPSVQFGLQFEVASEEDAVEGEVLELPKAADDEGEKPAAPEGDAEVVSLDAFRKKN